MLLRLVFNHCVSINLQDDDLDLKTYGIYLTTVFVVPGMSHVKFLM